MELPDGNFFAQGNIRATEYSPSGIFWAKFILNPSTGDITPIFQKVFGGSRDDMVSFGFVSTNDGGFIGAGYSNSYGADENDYDILIIKINSSGNIQWSRVFHYGSRDFPSPLLEINNGYLLCFTVANVSGGQNILVAKLDFSGNPLWVKLYGGSETSWPGARLQEISGGNYLLVGQETTQTSQEGDRGKEIEGHILKIKY